MSGFETLMGAGLVATAAGSVWFDLRERRLPNALTISALAMALAFRATLGLPELGSGLGAAAVCLLLALPFFMAGGLGGGDVKLLTATGAFVGWGDLPTMLLATALAGGLLALYAVMRRRALRRTLQSTRMLLQNLSTRLFTGWKAEASEAPLTINSPGAITVPYGIAIALGGLTGWYLG